MTVHYELTFADFAEASRGLYAARKSRASWILFGLIVATILAAGGMLVAKVAVAASPAKALVLALVGFPVTVLSTGLYLVATVVPPRLPPSRRLIDVTGRLRWPVSVRTINVLLATLAALLSTVPEDVGTRTGARPLTTAVTFASVELLMFAWWGGAALFRRRAYAAQPDLARRHTATFAAGTATFDRDLARTVYHPAGIVSAIETPRLFLVCPSALTFESVPKRAFGSADEVDAFRRLIWRWTTLRPDPFPVELDE